MTNRFPVRKHTSVADYLDDYVAALAAALGKVDRNQLAKAESLLGRALERDAQIFACGNGGSAAISSHLACDHGKGIRADTALRPRVTSLSANVELITAIANDMAFSEIFAYQLESAGRPGDLLITISSSGDSENVVRAVEWARANQVGTIAMTGFDGGRSAQLADVNLHVPAHNYGIVEDVHQSLMHVLAQFIRQFRMDAALVPQRKF
ncbi:MAG: SIS domain-containing protein [Ferrovibrio sp.]